jgi:hypothetical protein
LNDRFILKQTNKTSTTQAIKVLNNPTKYIDINSLSLKERKALYKPFMKIGMTDNPDHQERILTLACKLSRVYLSNVQNIDQSKIYSDEYKEVLRARAYHRAVVNLTESYNKQMSGLSLMEFIRVYSDQKAIWIKSTSKDKRAEHLKLVGTIFSVATGIITKYNRDTEVVDIGLTTGRIGLYPKQLINCKCDMVLITVLDDVFERFFDMKYKDFKEYLQ